MLIVALLASCGRTVQKTTAPPSKAYFEAAPKSPPKPVKKPIPLDQKKREQLRLNYLFQKGRPASARLKANHPLLSFQSLNQNLARGRKQKLFGQEAYQAALGLSEYLEQHADRLSQLFQIPFEYQEKVERSPDLEGRGRVFMTPLQWSMLEHCQKRMEHLQPGVQVKATSGYQSPAFRLLVMAGLDTSFAQAVTQQAPPHYSDHHLAEPTLSLEIYPNDPALWQAMTQECQEFGFRALGQGELAFVGQEALYGSILDNPLLVDLKLDWIKAQKEAGFYPSPQGLRFILAMALKESSLEWDPKVNEQKKEELRSKFDKFLAKTEKGLLGQLSSLMLDPKLEREKERLTQELHRLTSTPGPVVREFDVYLWSRKAHVFMQKLKTAYGTAAKLGSIFFDVDSYLDRLQYEPQTFGLWQVNVNHLLEELRPDKKAAKRYPGLLTRGVWNRDLLVQALSGRDLPQQSRADSLHLLITQVLAPRYQNHWTGDEQDMLFFVAENLAGHLSTYRVAVQRELNRQMKLKLAEDGDLARYQPYSLKPDLERPSRTQAALSNYARLKKRLLGKGDSNQAVAELILAKDRKSLLASKLYQVLMKGHEGRRLFPPIRSTLYGQTPKSYARKTAELAASF